MSTLVQLLLFFVVRLGRRLLDLSVNLICSLLYHGQRRQLPPLKDALLLEPASRLAARIRKRQVKSVDVMKSYIARIREVQPYLNAVVEDRFQMALEEARKADELVTSGVMSEEVLSREMPFLGVPLSVKEAIAVRGLSFTSGMVSRKNLRASKDAPVVEALRTAGAIPVVVTNTPELCMWWDTYNYLHGRSNNAYDTTRIAGGSSGGEGALLGAAGSVIGVGSDIGGSVRMPASFNGVFAHKPSRGVLPIEGHFPMPTGELHKYGTLGPMCRYAADLLPMMKAMTRGNASKVTLDEPVDIKTIKVYYMKDDGNNPFTTPVHPSVKKAFEMVSEHFWSTHRVQPQSVKLKGLRHSFFQWAARMEYGNEASLKEQLCGENKNVNLYLEAVKSMFGWSDHYLPVLLFALCEQLNMTKEGELIRSVERSCSRLQRELETLLKGNAVFLYPTHPEPAPYHGQTIPKFFNSGYTCMFNILGLPVSQCPVGLSPEGLPVGIQIVGAMNNDHLTMSVAVELEKAFGGWLPPCEIRLADKGRAGA